MKVVAAIFLIVFAAFPALGEDLFVGTFESETRANYGSDTAGEYRIEVTALSTNRYAATMYHRGKILGKQELIPCPIEREDYLNSRAPGLAKVLCEDQGYGHGHGVISFSENGISMSVVKPKYINNPELVRQEGLKPGDAALFETRQYKTKYYAHVQGFFYGFRKISS